MMKILLLTTTFYPDTAIAAVRPYMFAEYLRKAGHSVTVIRSGEINSRADESRMYGNNDFRVISYFGADSPAERFMRGESVEFNNAKSRISFLPASIRKPIAVLYHRVMCPIKWVKTASDAKYRNSLQRNVIDALRDEHFDIIWATVGNFENINAARYAAEVFHCPWIADFRDPMAQMSSQGFLWYYAMKKFERNAVTDADATIAVSHALADKLSKRAGGKPVYTIHNGYDGGNILMEEASAEDNKLSFCYTGQLYRGKRDCSPLFEMIAQLHKRGKLSMENIAFEYAGSDFEELLRQAKKYGVETILHNNGYLNREEVLKLQAQSDVFTVLSWNTKQEQGILTGKLYEGIRAHKPTLSLVSGHVPNSELYLLNEQYHYGFCYEESGGKNALSALSDWVAEAYRCKMERKSIPYHPSPDLFTDFRYDKLTKKLEEVMSSLFHT